MWATVHSAYDLAPLYASHYISYSTYSRYFSFVNLLADAFAPHECAVVNIKFPSRNGVQVEWTASVISPDTRGLWLVSKKTVDRTFCPAMYDDNFKIQISRNRKFIFAVCSVIWFFLVQLSLYWPIFCWLHAEKFLFEQSLCIGRTRWLAQCP